MAYRDLREFIGQLEKSGELKRIGVDRALAKAGARDGDTVHIAEMSFIWYRDQPEFIGQPTSRRRRR